MFSVDKDGANPGAESDGPKTNSECHSPFLNQFASFPKNRFIGTFQNASPLELNFWARRRRYPH